MAPPSGRCRNCNFFFLFFYLAPPTGRCRNCNFFFLFFYLSPPTGRCRNCNFFFFFFFICRPPRAAVSTAAPVFFLSLFSNGSINRGQKKSLSFFLMVVLLDHLASTGESTNSPASLAPGHPANKMVVFCGTTGQPGTPRGGHQNLNQGLTVNRSQSLVCSATYQTPTQNQVVCKCFNTRSLSGSDWARAKRTILRCLLRVR